MELKFDRERNREQRREFVRFHARWVKSVPNETWSRRQADLIDSFLENAQNLDMTPEQYLMVVEAGGPVLAKGDNLLEPVPPSLLDITRALGKWPFRSERGHTPLRCNASLAQRSMKP